MKVQQMGLLPQVPGQPQVPVGGDPVEVHQVVHAVVAHHARHAKAPQGVQQLVVGP